MGPLKYLYSIYQVLLLQLCPILRFFPWESRAQAFPRTREPLHSTWKLIVQALDFSVARLGCVIYNRRALDDGDKVTLANSLLAPPPEMKEASLSADSPRHAAPIAGLKETRVTLYLLSPYSTVRIISAFTRPCFCSSTSDLSNTMQFLLLHSKSATYVDTKVSLICKSLMGLFFWGGGRGGQLQPVCATNFPGTCAYFLSTNAHQKMN